MKKSFKKFLWVWWEWLAHIMARSYIVGPELKDAVRVGHRLAPSQSLTMCYWNTEEESPRTVASAYVSAIDALAQEKFKGYVSIKAPAIGFDNQLLGEVLERGRGKGVRLHFDALAPEAADKTFGMISDALPQFPDIGCTLPGRWRRSLSDADWAAEHQVPVRVVKGQWPDCIKPEMDLRQGFLAVIDRLAGCARHVAVATHDAPLAEESLKRLLKTNTSCELELLYGLPLKPAMRVAQEAGVNVRMYLPYGHGWLPYSISQVYERPRIIRWVFRDFVKAWMMIGILLLTGWVRAEIPQPSLLTLTSQENGTVSQDTLSCSGKIYGYLTFPHTQTGKHTLEGIWIGPKGNVVQHSRDEVDYPQSGSRTAAIWLEFTKEGTIWNPLSIQNSADQDHLLYDGKWKIEVRWDDQEFTRSNFQIHCQ